jgi:hypothetical protein
MSDPLRSISLPRLRSPLKPRRFRLKRRTRNYDLTTPVVLTAAFLAGLRFRRACREGRCSHPRHHRRHARNVRDMRRRLNARR